MLKVNRRAYLSVLFSGILLGMMISLTVYTVATIVTARRAANSEEIFTNQQLLDAYEKVRRSTLVVRAHFGNQVALGSGVVVLAEGGRCVAFTNAHVVSPNNKEPDYVEVKPYGTRNFHPARILNVLLDEKQNLDLAVLVFTDRWQRGIAASLPSDDEKISPGKVVIAVGNPRGDEFLTDHGRIKEVETRGGIRVIIHDALTEHGSSGGGLFDLHGHLLGINTWLVAERYGVAAEIRSVIKAFEVHKQMQQQGNGDH